MYQIISDCQEGLTAGNDSVIKSLSSRKDAEMLKLIDCGCGQHSPQQITFTGATAALVARLILNLPPVNGGPTYICEHGHTHRLTFYQREEKMTSSSPESEMASVTPPLPLTRIPGGERTVSLFPRRGAPCVLWGLNGLTPPRLLLPQGSRPSA
jgi:hypothetical protein